MAVLMVGGTGMLAGTAVGLAQDGEDVFLLSRSAEGFTRVRDRAGPAAVHLHWHAVDYTDARAWTAALRTILHQHHPETAVVWMSDRPAFDIFVQLVAAERASKPWRLFRVRGSAAAREPAAPPRVASCLYRLVILGFVLEGDGSRWLSRDEIGSGVLDAVRHDRERSVVGTVEPWDRRPSY